jgi:hypothetical protein
MSKLPNRRGKWAWCMFSETVILLIAFGVPAQGDDLASTVPAASEPPDKWQYTLFDPVPVDQLRALVPDRPSKTDSPITIDAGHLQIETGIVDYVDAQDRLDGANGRNQALDFGQVEFRLGILNDLELQAYVNAYNSDQEQDFIANQSSRQTGFGDTSIGAKLNFWGDDMGSNDWENAFGFIPLFKIPTAQDNLGNGQPEAFLGFPFQVNLPDQFGWGVETIGSWERNSLNDGYVAGWANMASVDRVIFGKYDVYVEYWMHTSTERHLEAQQTIDLGCTYPLSEKVVLDTGWNFGLNKASNTLEATAGITVRF